MFAERAKAKSTCVDVYMPDTRHTYPCIHLRIFYSSVEVSITLKELSHHLPSHSDGLLARLSSHAPSSYSAPRNRGAREW